MKKKLTDKQKAAKKRLSVAIDHLFKANGEINRAMSDISRVNGASVPYRKLTKVFNDLGEAKLMLGQLEIDSKLEMDHDPTPQELRCGHGPQHGCGRGKKS